MEDDALPPSARQIVEGEPDIPLDAPRERHSCIIEEVWDEGRRYIGLRVAVDQTERDAYTHPGQYVTLSPEHIKPRFLVIANAPDQPPEAGWEFLVDGKTDLGQSIDPLTSGSTLAISAPEGPGWPLDEVTGRPVLCFATGSGIASIRPLLQYWAHRTDLAPSQVTVYYGESEAGDFAYLDENAEWNRQGIRTFHCNGSAGDDTEEFRYVQHAFEADDPDLEDAYVFLAGAPIMKRAIVERLIARDFPLDHIATNV